MSAVFNLILNEKLFKILAAEYEFELQIEAINYSNI